MPSLLTHPRPLTCTAKGIWLDQQQRIISHSTTKVYVKLDYNWPGLLPMRPSSHARLARKKTKKEVSWEGRGKSKNGNVKLRPEEDEDERLGWSGVFLPSVSFRPPRLTDQSGNNTRNSILFIDTVLMSKTKVKDDRKSQKALTALHAFTKEVSLQVQRYLWY